MLCLSLFTSYNSNKKLQEDLVPVGVLKGSETVKYILLGLNLFPSSYKFKNGWIKQ